MDGSQLPQQPSLVPVLAPVMTKEKFAALSGLAEGVVQGMIEKGHLPSVKIGRYRLINLVSLNLYCEAKAREAAPPPQPH